MTDPTLTPEIYGADHANPQGLAAAKASMDAAPMNEFDRLSHAMTYLGFARDALLLATRRDGSRDHHHADAIANLHIAADRLGLRVLPK